LYRPDILCLKPIPWQYFLHLIKINVHPKNAAKGEQGKGLAKAEVDLLAKEQIGERGRPSRCRN
jgi:hypothetical protein